MLVKFFSTGFFVFSVLTVAGCAQLRTLNKVDGATQVALSDIVQPTSFVMIEVYTKCLIKNGTSEKSLQDATIKTNFNSIFVVDGQNSAVSSFEIANLAMPVSSTNICQKISRETASRELLKRVKKYSAETGLNGYRNKFYLDGSLFPVLYGELSDEPISTKDRVVYGRLHR